MKRFLVTISAALFLSTISQLPAADDAKAKQLATDVWKASGGENWSKVTEIRFTFAVEQDGKTLMSADHVWNVAAMTDAVSWKDKHVTVNLLAPAQDADAKAAYARWVNDAYWLLAPLKLLDAGVNLSYEGEEQVDGAPLEKLHLSFGKVGLTSGDQYTLFIDPKTKLVRAWDYMPKPGTKLHGTWEGYRETGGLKLSTEHAFAGKAIRIPLLEVIAAAP